MLSRARLGARARNRGRRRTLGGDANARPLDLPERKNKVLRVFDVAESVKVLHVRVFACLGFGIIRCSADASVAHFNKQRLVGLSGPLI